MTEQRRGGHSAPEGGEVGRDVVDRSDESLVDDVGYGHEEAARERR